MATVLSLQGVFRQSYRVLLGRCLWSFRGRGSSIIIIFWLCGKLTKIFIHLPVIISFFSRLKIYIFPVTAHGPMKARNREILSKYKYFLA